ncbi:ComEA family DNA-binding protein [Actinomadura parmotrematis]|uniref:Helix-hairpin-helix domain-containing protein n=1 Tax=Actinomadura parmotrematis TaxID=2864039 RepID=A0ABS7FZV4_9ACTN|nr:helix-hairpin-helix domain-containing protein [Actinomadura parmotrematis]MBW8485097.1 helix-hairpin-helix domain-containing protein [Actinomadura parmotrematis]
MDYDTDGPFRPGPYPPGRPPGPPPRPPRPPYHRPPVQPGWAGGYRSPHQPPYPPPPQLPPLPRDAPEGILWAFVPLLTFGYGTPFSFAYAAFRRRSRTMAATAAGYGVATLGAMMLMGVGGVVAPALGVLMMMMLWVLGAGHAFAVRSSVFPRLTPRNASNEQAIRMARYRKVLRDEARELAAGDPALAHELRIGRPDLPRTYDDGGLIDANHAPAHVLARLPGVTPALVDRLVRHRDEHGGFISAEELAVDIDVPPALLPAIAEYTIFMP